MGFHSTRLARQRKAPVGFIRPCQPVLAAHAPSGPEWIHEIKHDGYRAVAKVGEGRVQLWSRHATVLTEGFPQITQALRALERDVVLDGELVCPLPSGHHDLASLGTRDGCRRAVLIVYDLLSLDGQDRRTEPLMARRTLLRALVEGHDPIVLFSDHLEGDGHLIFEHACKLGLEGIVSKRRDSLYRSGNSKAWIKTKNPDYRSGPGR